MKITFSFIFILFSFTACSDKQFTNTMEQGRTAISGNKPPKFYKIANVQTMKDYVFDMKDYTISPPLAIRKDFTLLGGWEGATHYGKDLTIYLDASLSYHIFISSSKISTYNERDREIDKYNIGYIQNRIYKYRPNAKVTIKSYGKENYPCVVIEDEKKGFKNTIKNGITYRCYKFNPTKTKAKDVLVSLTYTKAPNLPTKYKKLAKQYTYEDLKRRAKRTLDSLYIKDGW